jgi:hypothetical protein
VILLRRRSGNAETGTVIYRSRKHANTKRNFEVFSAADFIGAITQHIPDKGFQGVCRKWVLSCVASRICQIRPLN